MIKYYALFFIALAVSGFLWAVIRGFIYFASVERHFSFVDADSKVAGVVSAMFCGLFFVTFMFKPYKREENEGQEEKEENSKRYHPE